MERLIIGCGYLGRRVAERWLAAGDRVYAATRSEQRAAEFTAAGIEPIVADVTDRASLASLPRCDTLLFAVGYDRSAEPSIGEVYVDGFRNVLDSLPAETGRVIYISTTGVYGNAGSDWVDEQTPTEPQRDGGKASLAAEEALRASPFGGRGVSLRLAGIYGPDRVPFLDRLRAGEPIPAPQHGCVNLIHVDDAADIVVSVSNHDASKRNAPLPSVLCVSDGNPPLRADYYREVARLIGAAEPTFTEPAPGTPRAARAKASKRVRNDLMIRSLGVSLRHGDYRSGLAAILGP
ncbi:MAG: SDR family oxidoreductase [Planctomycetota bacterium]